jgi:hypothetical protein
MIMREFLYADLDRVRSILAQISGGVPEEDRVTQGSSRRLISECRATLVILEMDVVRSISKDRFSMPYFRSSKKYSTLKDG